MQYEGGEKCATCGHVLHGAAQCSAPDSSAMPTTILPGFLYLGSYDHASRLELLKTMGIDHILSVRAHSTACCQPACAHQALTGARAPAAGA